MKLAPTILTVLAIASATYFAALPPASVNPKPLPHTLQWDYEPLPEDVGRPIAFNLWESTNQINWKLLATTTNDQFEINPTPPDFFRVSSFFPSTFTN